MSVVAASLMLAVMISPTMILFFSDSLLAVDPAYCRAAKALGATRVQRLLYIMLPKALGGMASGFILALGRALGDTLIALMLAGNAIAAPESLLDPARTLTAHIALENLPATVRKTAPVLGATKFQNIVHVLVPRALAGIGSGVMLAIGRCAEDTAVIMLTGVVATAGVPRSPLSSYEALPFYIYYISRQYTDQAELSRGYGACVILMATCAVLFMLAYTIQRRLTYRSLFRL